MLEHLFASEGKKIKNSDAKLTKPRKLFSIKSIENALDNANTTPLSNDGSLNGISIDKRHVNSFDGKITIKDNMISALKAGKGEDEVKEIDIEVTRLRQRMESLLDSRRDLVLVINALKPGTYPEV